MTPKFIERMRERKQARAAVSEREELDALRRANVTLSDEVTRYINVNNRLWGAMKYLPGGLEAARKISIGN